MPTTLKFNKQNIVNHATLSFTGTKSKKKTGKYLFGINLVQKIYTFSLS